MKRFQFLQEKKYFCIKEDFFSLDKKIWHMEKNKCHFSILEDSYFLKKHKENSFLLTQILIYVRNDNWRENTKIKIKVKIKRNLIDDKWFKNKIINLI